MTTMIDQSMTPKSNARRSLPVEACTYACTAVLRPSIQINWKRGDEQHGIAWQRASRGNERRALFFGYHRLIDQSNFYLIEKSMKSIYFSIFIKFG